MKAKRVLLVSPSFPYPLDFGGAVDIWGRVKFLRNSGFEVDLVCTVKDTVEDEHRAVVEGLVSRLFLVERKNKVVDFLFSRYPLQVASRKKLSDFSFSDSYEYLWLEGEYVAAVLSNKTLQYKHSVMRVHNDEASYFSSLARSARYKPQGIYYWQESYKFKKLQQWIFSSVNKFFFISPVEQQSFSKRYPQQQAKFFYLPPPVTIDQFKSRNLKSKKVIFVGSLFMPNNVEAIQWYLKHVHPGLLSIAGYQFIVAGSTRGSLPEGLLQKLQSSQAVELHTNVADLDPLYEQASVFVNPMINGAGVKIKSLNAVAEGLPLVSTPVGVEGSGLIAGEHFLLAENPADFLQAVKTLLEQPERRLELVQKAQDYFKLNGHDRILKEFFGSNA